MAAWKKYPIVKDEVVAAEKSFFQTIVPVKEAVQDATINVLNTLTADQRPEFDQSFMTCIKAK